MGDKWKWVGTIRSRVVSKLEAKEGKVLDRKMVQRCVFARVLLDFILPSN